MISYQVVYLRKWSKLKELKKGTRHYDLKNLLENKTLPCLERMDTEPFLRLALQKTTKQGEENRGELKVKTIADQKQHKDWKLESRYIWEQTNTAFHTSSQTQWCCFKQQMAWIVHRFVCLPENLEGQCQAISLWPDKSTRVTQQENNPTHSIKCTPEWLKEATNKVGPKSDWDALAWTVLQCGWTWGKVGQSFTTEMWKTHCQCLMAVLAAKG